MRQTKRQRTRDAACQTLTYRQLRDGANPTPASKRNDPTSCKHSTNNVKPSPEEAQQARPRQGRQQPQESGFHVVPASRLVSMLNPANGPASSATTVSTASVYRVTDGGGIVHGAVVRGGTRSSTDGDERRRGLRQRQTNMAGREGGDGDFSDNVGGAEGFKSREAQTGGVSASTAPQGGRRGDGPTLHSPTEGKNGRELDALPPDGAGMVLCTPVPSTQRQASLLNDPQQRPAQERPAQAPSPLEQHEAIGDRRLSPTLGQVAISWGRETENETAEAMRGSRPSAAKDPAAALSTCSRGGREPVSLRIDRGVWEVGCSDLMSSPQGGGKRGSAGSEGFAYEPLSKGPDYRKVTRRLFRIPITNALHTQHVKNTVSQRNTCSGKSLPCRAVSQSPAESEIFRGHMPAIRHFPPFSVVDVAAFSGSTLHCGRCRLPNTAASPPLSSTAREI